jgi:hypothetical protein
MTAFTASRDLRDWTTALASQPEPPALVLNEPSCYHFRVLDPRLPLRWRLQPRSLVMRTTLPRLYNESFRPRRLSARRHGRATP